MDVPLCVCVCVCVCVCPQWESSAGAPVPAAVAAESALSSACDLSQSYEDLCREHVSAYLASAEQYLSSSLLSRRVLDWQERILPILEAEEAHPPYDIQQYGRNMLKIVEGNKDNEQGTTEEQRTHGQRRRQTAGGIKLHSIQVELTRPFCASQRRPSSPSLCVCVCVCV